MKRLALALVAAAALARPLHLGAQEVPTPPDLPPTAQAIAWIDKDPSVQEARSDLAAAGHDAAALNASPHEWTARAQTQRRSFADTGRAGQEWMAHIERAVRVNGKPALDRRLGEHGLEIARARVGEARHEAARALSDLWLEAAAAHRLQALLAQQIELAQANLDAVQKRRRAGDASTLDHNLAATDLAEVRRQASLAATQLAKTQARLQVRFAGAQPAAGALSEPVAPMWTQAQWRDRILSEADPIKVAQGRWRRAQATAERLAADRVPDPTVGVFAGSEALRNERVVGITVSIPLSGSLRHERMLQALREADTAQAAVDRQRQEIEVEVATAYAEATGSHERWRIAEQAASAASDTAKLMQRAYALGEADVQSLMLARRQALDATRAALEARVDALRWHHRLLIDAHLIWDLARD